MIFNHSERLLQCHLCVAPTSQSLKSAKLWSQGRRHGVDWGGHVYSCTFSRGIVFWELCKSGDILSGGGESVTFAA